MPDPFSLVLQCLPLSMRCIWHEKNKHIFQWVAVFGLIAASVLALPAQLAWAVPAATPAWIPLSDTEIVEQLPERIRRVQPASPASAASAANVTNPAAAALEARQAIALSRRLADPRYLGRAEATLARWWNRPDAPAEIAILQATIEQSRHEFDRARATLKAALARDPSQAQGWLTLATLARLSADYAAADAACKRVEQAGALLYAQACLLETQSLRGDFAVVNPAFAVLTEQSTEPSVKAWLLSLQAESLERAGNRSAASAAYRRSLQLDADGNTALAYADFLLRQRQPAEATQVLANQPESDAVLIRRAYALKLQNDPRWNTLRDTLVSRFAELDARGEDSRLHARERGLAALWLDGTPLSAWKFAQDNLVLQKEPLDWFLAFAAAEAASLPAEVRLLSSALQRTGLRDVRLARWQSVASAAKVASATAQPKGKSP